MMFQIDLLLINEFDAFVFRETKETSLFHGQQIRDQKLSIVGKRNEILVEERIEVGAQQNPVVRIEALSIAPGGRVDSLARRKPGPSGPGRGVRQPRSQTEGGDDSLAGAR